jgi:hypothetical protein
VAVAAAVKDDNLALSWLQLAVIDDALTRAESHPSYGDYLASVEANGYSKAFFLYQAVCASTVQVGSASLVSIVQSAFSCTQEPEESDSAYGARLRRLFEDLKKQFAVTAADVSAIAALPHATAASGLYLSVDTLETVMFLAGLVPSDQHARSLYAILQEHGVSSGSRSGHASFPPPSQVVARVIADQSFRDGFTRTDPLALRAAAAVPPASSPPHVAAAAVVCNRCRSFLLSSTGHAWDACPFNPAAPKFVGDAALQKRLADRDARRPASGASTRTPGRSPRAAVATASPGAPAPAAAPTAVAPTPGAPVVDPGAFLSFMKIIESLGKPSE